MQDELLSNVWFKTSDRGARIGRVRAGDYMDIDRVAMCLQSLCEQMQAKPEWRPSIMLEIVFPVNDARADVLLDPLTRLGQWCRDRKVEVGVSMTVQAKLLSSLHAWFPCWTHLYDQDEEFRHVANADTWSAEDRAAAHQALAGERNERGYQLLVCNDPRVFHEWNAVEVDAHMAREWFAHEPRTMPLDVLFPSAWERMLCNA